MQQDIQKVIDLIENKFPYSVYLAKSLDKNLREPVAHFFRISPTALSILFLFVDSNDGTWSVTQYECPSEEDYKEFVAQWSKWGLFNKILDWHHEEVNLIE